MRSRLWASAVLLLVVAGAATVAPQVRRGEQDPKPSVRSPDGETLRLAQELSRTTVEHERLQKLVGEWSATLRTHGADGAVQEVRGKVVGQSILGGRYVVCNLQAKVKGLPVEAVQILGFDTLRKAYTSSWRDNATTWPVECHGGLGKQPDVLTLTGMLHDAHTPNGRGFRMQLDLREQDKVTVKVFEDRGLDEVLMQDQVWTR